MRACVLNNVLYIMHISVLFEHTHLSYCPEFIVWRVQNMQMGLKLKRSLICAVLHCNFRISIFDFNGLHLYNSISNNRNNHRHMHTRSHITRDQLNACHAYNLITWDCVRARGCVPIKDETTNIRFESTAAILYVQDQARFRSMLMRTRHPGAQSASRTRCAVARVIYSCWANNSECLCRVNFYITYQQCTMWLR